MIRVPQHHGVFIAFCIYAMALGAISPRLGDMQVQMGIGVGQLDMSVIGAALGVQLSLLVAGRICEQLDFAGSWLLAL